MFVICHKTKDRYRPKVERRERLSAAASCVELYWFVSDIIVRPYQDHSTQQLLYAPQSERATCSPQKRRPANHPSHKIGHRIDRRRDPRIEQPE
jgi:hypothetical protein